jgi:hypothetical protein
MNIMAKSWRIVVVFIGGMVTTLPISAQTATKHIAVSVLGGISSSPVVVPRITIPRSLPGTFELDETNRLPVIRFDGRIRWNRLTSTVVTFDHYASSSVQSPPYTAGRLFFQPAVTVVDRVAQRGWSLRFGQTLDTPQDKRLQGWVGLALVLRTLHVHQDTFDVQVGPPGPHQTTGNYFEVRDDQQTMVGAFAGGRVMLGRLAFVATEVEASAGDRHCSSSNCALHHHTDMGSVTWLAGAGVVF